MKAWERQLREPIRSFLAFQHLLELGPTGTLKQVAADLGLKESIVRSWSSKHKWRPRATEWEEFLADQSRKRTQKILENDAEKWAHRRVDLREKEYALAEKLMTKAEEILALPHVQTEVTENRIVEGKDGPITVPVAITLKPVRCNPAQAANMGEIASRMLRMSAEMETSRDRLDVNVTNDTEKLEKAQAALEKIRDEILANLMQETPEFRNEVTASLPAWIADSFDVSPEALVDGALITMPPKQIETNLNVTSIIENALLDPEDEEEERAA